MGRNILFITTDQQRYDSLGCNGGKIAQTPVADKLAAERNQLSARAQSECGLHAGALDDDHRPVRAHPRRRSPTASRCRPTRRASRPICTRRPATAPRCWARRISSPAFDLQGRWFENSMAREDSTGPYRGFDRMELAMHVPVGGWHYSLWMHEKPSRRTGRLRTAAERAPGGDTGAPEVKYNPIPREHYHTDWVADRTIAYLDSLDPDETGSCG